MGVLDVATTNGCSETGEVDYVSVGTYNLHDEKWEILCEDSSLSVTRRSTLFCVGVERP